MDNEVDEYVRTNHMKDYIFRSPFRTDVPEILNSIDVYCLPSLWEGLSIALLEAMAMEKAIIATPTDGTCELIHNEENGLVIPFNDVQSLTDAIVTLSESPEKCKLYGTSARSLVENNYNAKHVSNEVTKLYFKFAK